MLPLGWRPGTPAGRGFRTAVSRRVRHLNRCADWTDRVDMNVSSVASAVTSLKAAETASQIQFAVAAKSLDQQKAQGAAVVKLIQGASANVDASVAAVSDAIGGLLDVAG